MTSAAAASSGVASSIQRPAIASSALRWLFVGLLAVPLLGGASLVGLVRRRFGWSLLTTWTRWTAAVFGIETAFDDQNVGDLGPPPFVFVQLNQTSLAEGLAVPLTLPAPVHVFMNVEYALIPFLGWAHVVLGGVIVVRQWKSQARSALTRCLRHLEKGRSLFLSIEGRRSPAGELGPYKKGPAILAIAAQARIVPVLIEGAYQCLPHGEWRVRPGRIKVTLLRQIDARGLSPDDRDGLVARLRTLAEHHLRDKPRVAVGEG